MQEQQEHKPHLQLVAKAAHAFVDLAAAQQTHQVALEALISAYVSIAVCHPCCADKAAALARAVAGLIETTAAPQGSASVH